MLLVDLDGGVLLLERDDLERFEVRLVPSLSYCLAVPNCVDRGPAL